MAFTRRSYEEARDSILAQITKGIVNERHTGEPSRTRYKLANTPVLKVVKVDGVVTGSQTTFQEGTDYRLTGDMLEWLGGGERPDDGTSFFVSYVFGGPTGITDVNPGSVTRTIVEAFSREIEFLYAQLNQVYLAGFIDTATGSALDLVVSILGVERKPAEQATGIVVYGRNTDPGEITIERETLLYDGQPSYELKSTPVKNVVKIDGTREGTTHTFEEGTDYTVTDGRVEWLPAGGAPALNTPFSVDYVAYERIVVPVGTRVSTYARRPEDTKSFVTAEERALQRTVAWRWEAEVPVRAVEAGQAGNVYAGAIIVMPQPLVGVEYVINRGDILTGVDAEADEELRERAKHALEVAGKATFVSLESAVRGVEGVSSLLIEDLSVLDEPERIPGVVRIIVYGGDDDAIQRVIDDTRAAGIRVEFTRPQHVHIDVTAPLTLERGASSSRVGQEVEATIRSYLSSLDIGDDVVFSRIVRAALEVEGVYDLSGLSVKAYRQEGEEAITSTQENIAISAEEMAVARAINVVVRTLDGGRQ
jgi:uncharacterized phage protein gp47/JayE